MVEKLPAQSWAAYARELGINIRRERIKQGLTQEQLAYTANISRFSYQQLEKGESRPGTPANPSLKNIMALAQVLKVPLTKLLPDNCPDLTA